MSKRVLAVSHADPDGPVYIFGEGVYEGDFIPEEAEGMFAEILKAAGRENPRIRLDSGKVVYGCECWWGSVDDAKKKMGIDQGREVIMVDIDEARKEAAMTESPVNKEAKDE